MEDKFLTLLLGEPNRGGFSLEPFWTNREGLVGHRMARVHLGHNDLKMIEFSSLGEITRKS